MGKNRRSWKCKAPGAYETDCEKTLMEFYEVNGVIMGKIFDMDQALKERRYGEAIAHLNNRVDLLQKTVNSLIKTQAKSEPKTASK